MEHRDSDSTPSDEPTPPEVDQMKLQIFMQSLRDNQNLSFGILGGAGAAFVGALLWALVTAVTDWQIGFMAVGIGFLVGYAIRNFGNGIDISFGITGAVLSLAGCLLGNLLVVGVAIAEQESMEIMDVLGQIDLALAIELMIETFNPMDLLFYGLAVYYGYKYSFRPITEEELATLTRT